MNASGVVGIRNLGLAAAFDHGLLTRAPGDTLVLAPPFTSAPADVDRMVDRLRAATLTTAGTMP